MHTNYNNLWSELDDMKKYGPSSRHTRRLIRLAARHIEFQSVVDVGCGDGTLLMHLKHWFPQVQKLYGLDISEEAIQKTAAKLPGAELMCWDATQQAPPIDADLAVCSEVLEHVEDDVAALQNISQMAPQIIVTVPAGTMTEDQKRAGHIRHYTVDMLTEKCSCAGLQPHTLRRGASRFSVSTNGHWQTSPAATKWANIPGTKSSCAMRSMVFLCSICQDAETASSPLFPPNAPRPDNALTCHFAKEAPDDKNRNRR